jgi:hypothetical protein
MRWHPRALVAFDDQPALWNDRNPVRGEHDPATGESWHFGLRRRVYQHACEYDNPRTFLLPLSEMTHV